MPVRSQGYPIVSQATLTAYMARYLATAEGMATAEQFAAAGIQSYFIANPIEDDIAADVAAYLAENPPANGQNATTAQVQEAVDAFFTMYSPQPGPQGEQGPVGPAGQSVTQAQLASAVAAYLQANPPQPGAQGPAGQNATDAQVAQGVAAYLTNNPLNSLVTSAVANYFAQNPQPVPATATPLADAGAGSVGVGTKYAREDHRHPAVTVNVPVAATNVPQADTAAGAIGTSAAYAREDHSHPLPTITGRAVFLATFNITETMIAAVQIGIRRRTITVAGAALNDRILIVLNGAPTTGCEVLNGYVTAANTLSVSVLVPNLGVNATYSVPVAIYKIV